MLRWAAIFFIISLIAGVLGFTDVAVGAADIARILFYIFLFIFLAVLVAGLMIGAKIKGA